MKWNKKNEMKYKIKNKIKYICRHFQQTKLKLLQYISGVDAVLISCNLRSVKSFFLFKKLSLLGSYPI